MSATAPLAQAIASIPAFPTSSEIVATVIQGIDGLKSLATNFNTGGLTRTYLEAIALNLGSDVSSLPNSTAEGAYEILATVRDAAFIATAKDFWLDLKCADVGVTRKGATAASVPITITIPTAAPAGGTLIPAGFLVQAEPADPTQQPIIFSTTADVTVAAGQQTSPAVTAQSTTTGSATNVEPGAIVAALTNPAYTVTNAIKAAGGADREEDDFPNGGLRARGLQAVANASQGTLAALENDAVSYAGITSAKAVDNTADDGVTFERGNVLLYCDDGSGTLGNSGNVNHASLVSFQNDLNSGKYHAAGVTVTVYGSLTLAATVALQIDVAQSWLNAGNTQAQAQANAQAAVYAVMEACALGVPARLADVIDAARGAAGVSNVIVSSARINGAASDLVVGPQYVARCVNGLTDVTVTVNAITPYA